MKAKQATPVNIMHSDSIILRLMYKMILWKTIVGKESFILYIQFQGVSSFLFMAVHCQRYDDFNVSDCLSSLLILPGGRGSFICIFSCIKTLFRMFYWSELRVLACLVDSWITAASSCPYADCDNVLFTLLSCYPLKCAYFAHLN